MLCTRLHLASFVFAACALLVPCLAGAQTHYTIVDLGTLPGYTYNWTWQQAINNQGMVAAYANNGDPPGTFASPGSVDPDAFYGDASYLWASGTISPLRGLPDAVDTIAFSLNNSGQVVGRSTQTGANQPVLWNNGVIHALPVLSGDNKGAALMINDNGLAVGYSANTNTGDRRAVSWSKGVVSQLPALPGGGVYDDALGINSMGQATGWSGPGGGSEHIALWSNGGVTDLGTLGGTWGDGYSINNKGQIVGQAATLLNEDVGDAFLWSNGVLSDLGVPIGDVGSVALQINNLGQIVGGSLSLESLNTGIPDHALLWENGVMIDLQTRIPANSGWTLLEAAGINDRGKIVGTGIHNGQYRNFVLTPK